MNTKMTQNKLFLIYGFISFLLYSVHHWPELSQFSFLQYFFKPIEVFFHESAHLLMALALNSQDISLYLSYDSGSIKHLSSTGHRYLISFVGYAGASAFGLLIYFSSIFESRNLKIFLMIYVAIFIPFVGDLFTLLILFYIMGLFFLCWKFFNVGKYVIQFIGVFVMVASIYSPTYLWAYSNSGDHITMANELWIPSFFWIIIWFFIGCLSLWFAFKASNKFNSINS